MVLSPLMLWVHLALLTVFCAALALLHARRRAPAGDHVALASSLGDDDPPSGCRRRGRLTPRQRARDEILGPVLQRELRRVLQLLGVPARDRDDVAQDTTIAAVRSLGQYDPRRAPVQWLARIAVHVADHYRRARQSERRMLAVVHADGRNLGPVPDEALAMAEERRAVRDAIMRARRRLSPAAAHVLVEHDLEERPLAEVAAELGVSLAHARLLRAGALRAVREALVIGRR